MPASLQKKNSQSLIDSAVPPPRPDPPIVGKVTHESIELYWDQAYQQAVDSGAGKRIKVQLQEQSQNSPWGSVYNGYSKRSTVQGLATQTEYRFRLKFANHKGDSEYSPATIVSTTKEPLNGEAVHKAVNRQDMELLERVLSSPEIHHCIDTPDRIGHSPLMNAASKGYIEIMELLLESGADANYQNTAGKTPLMMACFYGQQAAVQLLHSRGARFDTRDSAGSTALHMACDGARATLVQWMLENGAKVNEEDLNGWTPLLRTATISGSRDVAYTLLSNGANVHARDHDGKSALTCAIINNNPNLVELLLLRGADLKSKNKQGKTPYDIALAMDKRLVIRAIEDFKEKRGFK